MLVHSLIMSRIDYCNSLFSGCSADTIADLQSTLNAAARMVSSTGRYNNVKPILKDLHWLPVEQRIPFKIAVTTYRCLTGGSLPYLKEMIAPTASNNRRSGLRSAERGYLIAPLSRTKRLSQHSFRHSAPPVWNALPEALRLSHSMESSTLFKFCKALKTHLFSLSYLLCDRNASAT